MRINYYFFFFFINAFFISTTTFTQTGNFDETWKEFLENNKISNMSELVKPNKAYEVPDYAKYLLMNTNTNFCQSKVEGAEELMEEIQEIDPQVHKSIPGYVLKMEDLQTKIKAYHTMDEIWNRFLETKEVDLDELDAITAAKTICEKTTLAKYSYMTAYHHFCNGNVSRSRKIFETRTLRLAEKTSLRVEDVEGLAAEVSNMKRLYQGMNKLDVAWDTYVKTGVSPGFETELPLFRCNPIPNMKVLVLRGAEDICNFAPVMLEEIKKLQEETGVTPKGELARKIKDLEGGIGNNDENLIALNKAWKAFIPDNKVKYSNRYGYDYCRQEPLIRAYIMDGFAYACELGEEMVQKIDSIQMADVPDLEDITLLKIDELVQLNRQHQEDAVDIEELWSKFVAQGDTLYRDYESAEYYCDNIHQVKDWVMKGLSGDCEVAYLYLQQINEFQETFEFNFLKDLECRVINLKIKVWDCRYKALLNLAKIQAPDSYEERLEELMEENGIEERPEVCLPDN